MPIYRNLASDDGDYIIIGTGRNTQILVTDDKTNKKSIDIVGKLRILGVKPTTKVGSKLKIDCTLPKR